MNAEQIQTLPLPLAGTPPAEQEAMPVTSIDGLSEAEAAARTARGLSNAYRARTSRTYLQILKQHAFSFINIVLFSLGIALVALGRIDDAILTAGMVFLNVVISVGQEGRAKHKLDRIALLTRPKATVVRDGEKRTVDPHDIVLGDVLEVGPGDQIVVDGQVIGEGWMEADESLLTGESDRVPKRAGDGVYSGSYCVTGSARYMANNVGASSFANKLTEGARAFRQVKTPLQHDIDFVVRMLVLLATQLGILIGLSFLYSDRPLIERVQIAAVIAALVPQGLFAMVTVTYAMGALRMSGKGALIQQINAIESLSNVDILCLDKTGTLTTNSLKVEATEPLGVTQDELTRLLGNFVVSMSESNKTADAIGQAFEGHKQEISEEALFSSARKWSALTFAGTGDEPAGTYVLGAPEMMQPGLEQGKALSAVWQQITEWADRGLRVLLFARAPEPTPLYPGQHKADELPEPKLPAGLIPVGLVCLRDELRPEAQATLKDFASAGVNIKIISGDNPQTVASLARQAGLDSNVKVISGLDLAAMNTDEFAQAATDTTIFGRITPQQKEQLVQVLRKKGHYVAMIGDGVNDVLSLKQAQLAIAMEAGSQATRGVADIVLLDDSFAVLPRAVLEGQRIIRGMQDVMRLMLTHTLCVTLLIIGCAIIEVAFPTTPKLRTVWTLLTVGIPTLAIAAWARPGPSPRSVVRSIAHFVLPAAVTMAMITLAVYLTYLLTTGNAELARTALTVTGVICGLLLIPFVEPPTAWWVAGDDLSGDWRPTVLSFGMAGLFAVVMVIDPFRDFFLLKPIPWQDLLLIAAAAAIWALGLRYAWRNRVFERLFRTGDS